METERQTGPTGLPLYRIRHESGKYAAEVQGSLIPNETGHDIILHQSVSGGDFWMISEVSSGLALAPKYCNSIPYVLSEYLPYAERNRDLMPGLIATCNEKYGTLESLPLMPTSEWKILEDAANKTPMPESIPGPNNSVIAEVIPDVTDGQSSRPTLPGDAQRTAEAVARVGSIRETTKAWEVVS